jgi:hypothetical protein
MTPIASPPNNPEAVHRALLAIARQRQADFNAILVQYAIERLIDRLSRSLETKRFVLKGAMVFRVWEGELQRPTKDVDFLGHGDPSPAAVRAAVASIVGMPLDDGLRFDVDSITVDEIRESEEYDGVRVTITCYLAHVPITVRMDVGFGDAVTPPAVALPFPTLLGHESPLVFTYPPETVVAEKIEAICKLGIINSRMKDYSDLIAISRGFEFGGSVLVDAIRATFHRRRTPLPESTPTGLSDEFAADGEKQRQWGAFLSRVNSDALPRSLADVVETIRSFILPILAAASGRTSPPDRWHRATGWSER